MLTALLAGKSWLRQLLAAISQPAIAWLIFTFLYLAWHDAALYDLALRHEWAHKLEHLTFLEGRCFLVAGDRTEPRACTKAWPTGCGLPMCWRPCPPTRIAGFAIANASEVLYPTTTPFPGSMG
jgi:cytochrome c oxidase assembly factor CtaG